MIAFISSVVASRMSCASLRLTLMAPRRAKRRCCIAAIVSERAPPTTGGTPAGVPRRPTGGGGAEVLDLPIAQAPVRARREAVQAQRPERDAFQRADGVADRLAHAPYLAVATLVDRQLDHVRLHAAGTCGRCGTVLEPHAAAQGAQGAVPHRAAAELRAVGLRHLEARVGQPVGELAVVREEDQPARVGVEATDGIQARVLGRVGRIPVSYTHL